MPDTSHFSHHFFSDFNHNRDGIYTFDYSHTTMANIEDVKLNFNFNYGIFLGLDEGSEVTLNNVEASYNEDVGLYFDTLKDTTQDPPADVILKGTNSVIGNKGIAGFYVSTDINAVVSRGATLNAYNNTKFGVVVVDPSTLTVKKGGAVNACGSGNDVDLVGLENSSIFPISGKGYTCDSVLDANNEFTSCENPCPVCALN